MHWAQGSREVVLRRSPAKFLAEARTGVGISIIPCESIEDALHLYAASFIVISMLLVYAASLAHHGCTLLV